MCKAILFTKSQKSLKIWSQNIHLGSYHKGKHTQNTTIQNRAGCIIANDFDSDHSGITVVKQLGLLTVLERRDYLILITIFKCLNDLAPHYLSDSFV